MLDTQRFVSGMTALSAAFGREIDGATQKLYYAVLSPRLNDEEFERAVTLTVSSETFWPSPATILGKVQADDTTKALLAFEHVNRVLGAHGGYRYISAETYHREFDAPTQAAISAVGGPGAIANTSEDRWPSLQKKFMAAFTNSTQPRIAAPQQDTKVRQLVRETASSMSGRDRALGRDA